MDLGSRLGKVFRRHLNQLIHSTYQDCFDSFKDQDPTSLSCYIHTTMLIRFPNPQGHHFSRQWLEEYVKNFLRNKKSSVQRATKRNFESPNHNYRPGNVHIEEWDKAMGELENKSVTRVQGLTHDKRRQGCSKHPRITV